MGADKKSVWNFYWPEIHDLDTAKKASDIGAAAGFFCAGVTVLALLIEFSNILGERIFNIDSSAFFDIILITGCAIGTRQRSRFAAVGALFLYWVERVIMMSEGDNHRSYFMVFILSAMFVTGIRGTFAYHRFKDLPPAPPNVPLVNYQRFGNESSANVSKGHFDPIAGLRDYGERKKNKMGDR
jgi:hypothetical protein